MPSGAVSDLEVLDPVEVRQNRFGQVPPRPLQVIDVAEDPQVLVPHLVEEAHGGRHGRQQKARYVDGVEWLDQDAHPGARRLLSGVEQALSHARPLGLEWHVRQRDPYVAEQLRAAQLIGDRERAGDAVAELDPAPRVVGDTDLASGMVAPGQVELHLPQPIASECRPDRAHVLAVRLRELHGLEASRGCTVEPLQERILREEPLDLPAPYVRSESEHGCSCSSLGSAGDPMPYGVRSMRIAYPIGLPTPEGRTIGPENPPFKALR